MYDCINDGANGSIINYADGSDNVHAKILEAASGAYDDGAKEMSRFICENRGVKWAAEQLLQLLEG